MESMNGFGLIAIVALVAALMFALETGGAAIAAAMDAVFPGEPARWENFNRRTRRQVFGIRIPTLAGLRTGLVNAFNRRLAGIREQLEQLQDSTLAARLAGIAGAEELRTLKEVRDEIGTKSAELAKVFKEAGSNYDMDKVTCLEGDDAKDSASKALWISTRNDALATLGEEVDTISKFANADAANKRIDSWLNMPAAGNGHIQPGGDGGAGGDNGNRGAGKTIGQLYVESAAYQDFASGSGPPVELDINLKSLLSFGRDAPGAETPAGKTLFQTSAGWAIESVRGDRVELTPERRLVVADLPMLSETSQNAIKYMEETTKTPAAAEAAEAGSYAEAAFALTERSSPVEKIAVFIPVTDEQFDDEPRARDYIDNRLIRAINERLDSQLLVGDGNAPNLEGILNVTGIQTQAKGADPVIDAVHKAITLVEHTGFAQPDAVVMHPNDWQAIRLLRTADGIYILGNPSERGPMRLWSLPVVVTTAETENTAIVGEFRTYSELSVKNGIQLKVSDSHSDFFIKGKLAIRAEIRVAFPVYRPKAFCTVTGI